MNVSAAYDVAGYHNKLVVFMLLFPVYMQHLFNPVRYRTNLSILSAADS